MASLQCPKPSNDTRQQKCDSNGNNHHSSGLGQKVAEVASWITGKQHTTDQAHCHKMTSGGVTAGCDSKTKKKGEHKKKKDKSSLLQKIKDACSDSSSSSDSESDSEGCHKRKN